MRIIDNGHNGQQHQRRNASPHVHTLQQVVTASGAQIATGSAFADAQRQSADQRVRWMMVVMMMMLGQVVLGGGDTLAVGGMLMMGSIVWLVSV